MSVKRLSAAGSRITTLSLLYDIIIVKGFQSFEVVYIYNLHTRQSFALIYTVLLEWLILRNDVYLYIYI